LVFPGIFRGLLDAGVAEVTPRIKIDAAQALAYILKKPTSNKLLPRITDKSAVKAIAKKVKKK